MKPKFRKRLTPRVAEFNLWCHQQAHRLKLQIIRDELYANGLLSTGESPADLRFGEYLRKADIDIERRGNCGKGVRMERP